jgi:mono/diheme cytochrome c family protein
LTSEEKAELKYYELGKNTFNMYCSACHRLSDKLVGPPLIETTKNHSIEWVIEFTRNPMRMIKEKKDPQAIKIYNEYNQLEMPRFESLRDSTIKAIFYFIDYRPNPEVAVP